MKIRTSRLLPAVLGVAFSLLPLTKSAQAWDSGGHMIISQIALTRLTPEARARANALLPNLVNPAKPEFRYDFVTAATWMDDIRDAQKLAGAEWTKDYPPLHYVDIEEDGSVPPGVNALTAIQGAIKTLQDPKSPQIDQVRALALLLHVSGDIHQPLHGVGREKGGNDFAITGIPDLFKGMDANFKAVPYRQPGGVYQRLHALWDSIYRYDATEQNGTTTITELYRPLESSDVAMYKPDRDWVRMTAMQLVEQYPVGPEEHQPDPANWARESAKEGYNWVFETPRAKQPSAEYIHRGYVLASQRLVVAGDRLGDLLNRVLTPQK